VPGESLELGVDLGGELARRRHPQLPRAGPGLAQQALEDRQHEGRRLPGARLGEAEDVTTRERGRQGLDLDRPGFGEARVFEGSAKLRTELESFEAGSLGASGSVS